MEVLENRPLHSSTLRYSLEVSFIKENCRYQYKTDFSITQILDSSVILYPRVRADSLL